MSLQTQKLEAPLGIAYRFFLVIISLFGLINAAVLIFVSLDPASEDTYLVIDTILCLIFFLDFLVALKRSPSKWRYLRWGWMDLVGCIPGLPLLRFLRLRRTGEIVISLRGQRLREILNALLKERVGAAVLFVLLIAFIGMTVIANIVLLAESASPDANITDTSEAFWWAFVTVATVGYGDYFPVTSTGRIMAMLLMTVGIGLFSVTASSLASWFLRPETSEDEAELTETEKVTQADLDSLHQELQSIRQEIQLLRENKPPASPVDEEGDQQS